VAKALPFLLAFVAMLIAFSNQSIGASFTWILNLTAGIGPVYLLRWCWWRINPWSEIAAMVASLPVLLVRPHLLQAMGWPPSLLVELLVMVLGSALVWLPVTLWTAPVDPKTLERFYARVRPPGWWGAFRTRSLEQPSWTGPLWQWLIGSYALLATTIGPLQVMVGSARQGWWLCASAAVAWAVVLASVFRRAVMLPRGD